MNPENIEPLMIIEAQGINSMMFMRTFWRVMKILLVNLTSVRHSKKGNNLLSFTDAKWLFVYFCHSERSREISAYKGRFLGYARNDNFWLCMLTAKYGGCGRLRMIQFCRQGALLRSSYRKSHPRCRRALLNQSARRSSGLFRLLQIVCLSYLYFTNNSAICTAFRAAPLRRLSATHQKFRP